MWNFYGKIAGTYSRYKLSYIIRHDIFITDKLWAHIVESIFAIGQKFRHLASNSNDLLGPWQFYNLLCQLSDYDA